MIDACDASPRAIQFATEHRRQANATLNLMTLDILNDDITDRYDLVMCSQFLHQDFGRLSCRLQSRQPSLQ